MNADLANDQRIIDDHIEARARKLTKQQKVVLAELRKGSQNTGYFCRLNPPILRVSERVRELRDRGYEIVNKKVAASGMPAGHALYQLSEQKP